MPPWERYQTQAAPAQSVQPSADPIIKPRDPYKDEDQQLQRNADARAAAAEARANDAAARAAASEERAANKDAQGTVEQGKSAGFLLRALQANDTYEAQDIEARSLAGEAMRNYAPSVLNSMPESIGNSPRRQVSDANQDEFIAATLRYESGAAIPPEELRAQRARYFPMPGDSEDAIKAKAQLRATAIEALKQSSGPLADPTYAKFMGTPKVGKARDAEGLFGFGGDDEEPMATVTDEGTAPPPSGGTPNDPADPTTDPNSPFYRDPSEIGGLTALAKQGLSLGLSDEVAGIGGFISALLPGGESPEDAYRRERDTERAFLDRARKEWGGAGTAAEFLGGGGAARMGQGALTFGNVLRQGTGLGALTGFGYGDGAEGSATNALLGAAGGAALGAGLYGAGKGLNALAARRAPAATPDMGVVEAGQRRNVPVRGPDVRPEMRQRRSDLRTSSVGQRIRDAEVEDLAAMETAVDRDLGGAAANPSRAGDAAQEGVKAARQGMKDRASRHYDRAHALSGRARITPERAIAAIDRNIAELQEAGPKGNKGQIDYLTELRDDLSRDGGLTVEALRNQRTNMRGNINSRNLSMTDAERRATQVLDAAAEDIATGLAGRPEALREFQAGDQIWRDRARFTKQIGERLLGPKDNPLSPTTTASRLENWASSDFRRFRDMWARLDEGTRTDIRSHLAGNLGRNQRGEFSLEFFLKHTGGGKGSTISDRTGKLIFGDDGMAAIRDLRALAKSKVDASSATNRSETGTALRRGMTGLRHILLTGLGFGAGDFTGAVAAPVAGAVISRLGEQRAARLMLNPDFTKWLRQTPNTANPAAIDKHFARLSSIPSIAANDNAAFQNAIREAFSRSPIAGAAAEDQDAKER